MSVPHDFDHTTYLSLNPDLRQTCNYQEAAHHYINYGIHEHRKYNKEVNKYNKEVNKYNKEVNKYNKEVNSDIHILVVIVSCNKHEHLWKKIKSRTNNDLIIISGTNERNKDKRWYDKENKVLWLNGNDYYDGLPEKIILMIEEVLTNPAFSHITHIIKIDDHDNEFTDENIKNLYSYNELKNFDYLGQKQNRWHGNIACNYHFGKVPEWSNWHNKTADISDITYFDGGCSYILSRRAMELINRKYNDSNIDQLRNDEIYEDIMIGRILSRENISRKELNYGIKGDK